MSSGGREGGSTELLHKLCSHLLRGAAEPVISSYYRSSLKLLTSTDSHGQPGPREEQVVVERLVRGLARQGRERDAAQLSNLHTKLISSSRNILRNRTSILSLLHSLGQKESSKAAPQPFLESNGHPRLSLSGAHTGRVAKHSGKLPSSQSAGRLDRPGSSSGFHPPLPPKPRSRPSSLYSTETDGQPAARPPAEATAVSQAELVSELLFVFQGIEGKLIKCDATDNFHLERGAAVGLSPHQLRQVTKLCEVGWLFRQLLAFTERQAAEVGYGLVGHSFVTALREEVTEYYRLLAALELEVRAGGVTLLQLAVWTRQPLARFRLLVEIVKGLGGVRGGALATVVYSFLSQGDPELAACVAALLSACCRPLYSMLLRWLLDGSLDDPHNEFMIGGDPSVQGEAVWHHKYSERVAMIPRFLSLAWTRKILSTGKSIQFLSSVCRDTSPLEGRAGLITRLEEMDPATLFRGELDSPLLEAVGTLYRTTARHVLDVMFGKFRLMDHMAALRKYLLLGQGDIMRYLLDLLEGELAQPATQLFPHNLAGILDTAIRGTNTQYEDPDILERLDVRIMEIQPGDTGWDVFSLDYKVSGPIGVVFKPDTMTQYLMLFNTLWRAKRMEWVLSCTWKKLASLHKMARLLPELAPVLHKANLVASEMIHFVHQMAYYVTFEVMECGWDALTKQISTAESLDEVISAHEEFLTTLVARALLDERSKEILTQLRAIYDRILEFQTIANRIHDDANSEWDSRQIRRALIEKETAGGGYGTSEQQEQAERERRKVYSKNKLGSAKAQLRILSQSYGDMVKTFLFQLTCSHDESLQCLSFRLDFNGHYKKKDSRLSKPLTFSHRRLSMSGINTPLMTASLASTGP